MIFKIKGNNAANIELKMNNSTVQLTIFNTDTEMHMWIEIKRQDWDELIELTTNKKDK